MSNSVDVAIIGAGPYGLSLAAYLSSVGVDFRIFGHPMESWRFQMPPGMLLKSYSGASSLFDPDSRFTLKEFCSEEGIDYDQAHMSLPVETFTSYGEKFQAKLVPGVERKRLTDLDHDGRGFRAKLDDGSVLTAKRVVVAVGVHSFKRWPEELDDLPDEFKSHSADHGPLDQFAGKQIVVIGSGASATDIAALAHEKGASVSLVARAADLRFAGGGGRADPSLARRLVRAAGAPVKDLVLPGSGIGRGWKLKICADAPGLVHALPSGWRKHIVETTLGPLGHASMRDRVLGRFPIFLRSRVESWDRQQGKLGLNVVSQDGGRRKLLVDHVICATGFKINLRRLAFLNAGLLSRIAMVEGNPVLSAAYEASAPGLYFIGPATALSFGPVSRFVCGAIHPARTLARHLSKTRLLISSQRGKLLSPTVPAQ